MTVAVACPVGTYLTDGTNLVQVLQEIDGLLHCEDASASAEEVAEVTKIGANRVVEPGAERLSGQWSIVLPAA